MTARTGRFARADRLLRSREFQHVTRQGRRAASSAYVVLVVSDPGAGRSRARLGVTVSRKVGNAVVRNRVKRRIREWFRRERAAFRPGLEIVVIARPEAARLDSAESDRVLSGLLTRASR